MRDKRWFGKTRTLDQQMTGLESLWPLLHGQSVLDIGCAEGLLSRECVKHGAAIVYGIDNRISAITAANLDAPKNCTFAVRDANSYSPVAGFDVVLMLAVLHKLRDPSAAFRRLLGACSDLCVVRLPHNDWPVLRDPRSGDRPHNLAAVAESAGFELLRVADGPVADGQPPEWVGFFKRR